MASENTYVRSGFLLLCLVWGSTWLAIKIGLESVPPFYGIAFRFSLAAAVLYGIMRIRHMEIPRDRESWNLFAAVGILSLGFPFSLIYWSEQFLSSGLTSVLFAVFPFVVAIFSHFFLPDEPLDAFKIVGIVVGFIGIVVIFFRGSAENGASGAISLLAMGGVVVSTILQASSVMIVKRKGKAMNPVTLNFGGMLVGSLTVALLAISFERISDIHLNAKAVGSIVYLGTFGSVLTFVVYYWLLKRLEAVYLSFLTFITPIVAVFLGTIILGETLDPNTFSGAGLVLVGIAIANGKSLRKLLSNSEKSKVIG